MVNRTYIYFIALCGLMIALSGCSIQQRVKKADKKYAIGEYYDAAQIYKQCYGRLNSRKDRELKAHVSFRQGECLRILNDPKAVSAYNNAIKLKYPDSTAYLRYAEVLMYQGKYREAEKAFRTYLEWQPDDYHAQAGVYACQNVAEWKKTPSRYKVQVAKDFAAKRASTFAPAFVGDNPDALMFTSNRQERTKAKEKKIQRPSPVTGQQLFRIYSARKNASGKWEDITLAEGLYDGDASAESTENDSTAGKAAPAEMGACCFSRDGKTMYITYSRPVNGQDLGARIYTSTRASGEWSEPQELVLFKDSSITVGHPAINATGDTLYFVSDAPGGYGGKDIWFAEYNGTEWSIPVNLGKQINTSGEELYPTIRSNGTLYFASTGHPGYGGLDIFKAERDTTAIDSLSGMGWAVYNMGAPFNTNGDDFGITFAGETESGFFSSNRGDRKGFDKIYSFVLPEMEFIVEGAVVDNNGEPISDASIRLVGNNGTNTKLQVRRDGTYKIKLQKDTKYVMLGTARGYLNQKQELNTFGLNDSKTYTQDFTLSPVSKPVTMDNIFYEFGKWELTPASESGLAALVKLLNDNPNITIELSAHTDYVGNDAANKELSAKRAQSVVNYLVSSGIERERLTPVGYGEEKPVVADATLHEKYKFIPVDQALTEEFISTLSSDQQDICNQINRRTEFKVLRTTYKLY
ncbi:MAG: OmpA family protein [Paludibacteraceae bacterium]|nr:OmpA family protein [Paludibacteraceae bacterium]